MKWQKEQEEFNRRKREHEIQLVEIERQEVERREEEVRRRNEDLDEKRRKHRMIQDAVTEQVGFLNIFKSFPYEIRKSFFVQLKN